MKKLKKSETEAYALLITDMLNDFINKGATLEVPAARAIIQPMRKEINKARKAQIPIIYCCDAHKVNDPEFKLWPRHAVKGTAGADVIKQIKTHKENYVISKNSYSFFYKTSLGRFL